MPGGANAGSAVHIHTLVSGFGNEGFTRVQPHPDA